MSKIRILADFSSETIQVRKQQNNIFKVLQDLKILKVKNTSAQNPVCVENIFQNQNQNISWMYKGQ